MFTPDLILIIVLSTQILTLNIVTTAKWVMAQRKIFQQYPATEYPNFYVFSMRTEYALLCTRICLDFVAITLTSYSLFTRFIEHTTYGIFTSWGFNTAIQLLPALFTLLFLQLAARKRKTITHQTQKSFSMIPRSIFDHISLFYIVLLIFSALLTMNIIVSNEQFTLLKKASLCGLFLATNALLIRQIISALYGKNNDKLLHSNDRDYKRKQDVQRSYIGIAASIGIFALFGMGGAKTTEEGVWLIIPLSLFIQFAVFHRTVRWHAKNMNVYKSSN